MNPHRKPYPRSRGVEQPSQQQLNVNPDLTALLQLAILQNSSVSQTQGHFTSNTGFGFQSFNYQNPTNGPHFRPPSFQYSQSSSGNQQLERIARLSNSQFGSKTILEELEEVVAHTRHELEVKRDSVSAQKVSASVLTLLKVNSWEEFGIRMQEIPSLNRLMTIEGKINAFIHCFIGVRRITTLYDLELEICKREGVEHFEDLSLGPICRQPLVLHYFALDPSTANPHKITTEEVILELSEYMDICNKKSIDADELLDFIAINRSVKKKRDLAVRIQSLGMHVAFIREVKGLEKGILKKCRDPILRKCSLTSRIEDDLEHHVLGAPKLTEPCRPRSAKFCGKHTRFASSSSENDESDDGTLQDKINGENRKTKTKSIGSYDRVSGCPYPSASEEFSRLGLSGGPSPSVGTSSSDFKRLHKKKKRKAVEENFLDSLESVKFKKNLRGERKELAIPRFLEIYDNFFDYTLTIKSMKDFIAIWLRQCKEQDVGKVLESMLEFYDVLGKCKYKKQRKVMKEAYKTYPFTGLLNVAVASIKSGFWDNTVQILCQDELKCSPSNENVKSPCEPGEKLNCSLTVEYIASMINKCDTLFDGFGVDGNIVNRLKRLHSCEEWLVTQLGVTDFKSIGYGDFCNFLQSNSSLLTSDVQKILFDDGTDKESLAVGVDPQQLDLLVSQGFNNMWSNEAITPEKISILMKRQFPTVCFKIARALPSTMDTMVGIQNEIYPKGVLFSASLVPEAEHRNPDCVLDRSAVKIGLQRTDCLKSFTSKDAITVLRAAPLLLDLRSWTNWDIFFAPSLGSMVEWLLNEVTPKDMFFLVTQDGNVIKLNEFATVESFLEAALKMSSFHTAADLLSLYSFAGGLKNMPVSLLKCYASQAFDVMLKSWPEVASDNGLERCSRHNPVTAGVKSLDSSSFNNLDCGSGVVMVCRFFLDCLFLLPSELHNIAADILLFGMQSVVRNAPLAILSESNTKERLILHKIGLSTGIDDWILDYHQLTVLEPSYLHGSSKNSKYSKDSSGRDITCLNMVNEKIIEIGLQPEQMPNDEACNIITTTYNATISIDDVVGLSNERASDRICEDGKSLIESIRKHEFGIDPGLSRMETDILQKNHARLGRALYCLSQELYSQDSHFLLELVQNADDNHYPREVEPTISFILKDSGVVILNNECGFSAENIRALCDIGNSTKPGSASGYVGQKGIGFKSVFRITDAPEIHSNGFHFKFDISEGQIGYVLPTIIPPCDIEYFNRLLLNTNAQHTEFWRTCIVLPFRSKLSKKTTTEMFLDLHPSLLLFLNRLQCIIFRNMLNDSRIIMRKQSKGDGIVNISCGEDSMNWLVASQHLPGNISRPKVDKTEIAIAFTLDQLDDGTYIPRLEQQPVFSFLPLRQYGLKFILQADFILPSSREEVDRDNAWNQWLLTKFPSLFVNAEKLFCSLSCFNKCPGKAVTTYMSFVPVAGEVHGFFSGIPRAIASELQRTPCLIVEGGDRIMVPPCNVLRGWNDQARSLMPDALLKELLGLGFMDRNIILSDSVARALGVAEYNADILIKFMSAMCAKEDGLKTLGFEWLSSWIAALSSLLPQPGQMDAIEKLRCIPFVPLSDGTYSSVDCGPIWFPSDGLNYRLDENQGIEMFSRIYSKLRMVNLHLLTASFVDNCETDKTLSLFHKIGVQRLSSHDIIKLHVLPTLCDESSLSEDKEFIAEYLTFTLVHLQSSCPHCLTERKYIISELSSKAVYVTNHGFHRLYSTPIHFSKEFGNPIDIRKLISLNDMEWLEIDATYLKHRANQLLSTPLASWRAFLREVGVTDFVKVSERNVSPPSTDIGTSCETKCSYSSTFKDWESKEMEQLLSHLTKAGCREKAHYLLEVLDTLWEDSLNDKTKCFSNSDNDSLPINSSFMNLICNTKWVPSNLDNDFHLPKDLFQDCDRVRSVLGSLAPYAVPKVKNAKLLNSIGFKSAVSLTDVAEILKKLGSPKTPFHASTSQFSRLYSYIWGQNASSETNLLKDLRSMPFIFMPLVPCSKDEQQLGVLLTLSEVCWRDPTGCLDLIEVAPHTALSCGYDPLIKRAIGNLYPGLHDLYVNCCRVPENPSFRSYLDILWQLSNCTSPSQAGYAVFKVLLKWTDGLKSGSLTSDDATFLKDSLTKKKYAVLPTLHDKWVSKHSSFGVICWSDDEDLLQLCKHLDNIHILSFRNRGEEQKIIKSEVHLIMQKLEIPALSELVTREAIFGGVSNRKSKTSLVNSVLPFAQRYIFKHHNDRYEQLKQPGFRDVAQLQVIVVSKLKYINKIGGKPLLHERIECSCVLEGTTLYTKPDADSHSLFVELSRVFFGGKSDLHLANFLHLIRTMSEAGYSDEQLESFAVNTQKVPQLPPSEAAWSVPYSPDSDSPIPEDCGTPECDQNGADYAKTTCSDWPPADWETAPELNSGFAKLLQSNLSSDWTIEEGISQTETARDAPAASISVRGCGGTHSDRKAEEAQLAGRLGEHVAFKYLASKFGKECVKWVNEVAESFLPYDISVKHGNSSKEFVEVKASRYSSKVWFTISTREWQFAVEKGDSFSILHVLLGDDNSAKVTIFRNPASLCHSGKLQLAIVMKSKDPS